MSSNSIHSVVADEFALVNEYILSQLKSEIPLIEQIGHYIISNGGKRLRPLMVLTAARACNPNIDTTHFDNIRMATTVEFIHTATLLHDDVVDESDMRRGKKTANEEWGNAPSVLVGDFLYSRAFQIMVDVGSMQCMKILAEATNVISEGEVQQLLNCGNPDTSEESYFKVIECKTAKLFEAALLCGAIMSNATEVQQTALASYGMHLGIAYQLIDDVMDYTSTAEEMGKNIGDDLAEGKPTLPLLYTMKHAPQEAVLRVRNAIETGGLEQLEQIITDVQNCGAIQHTQDRAIKHAELAVEAITDLEESSYRSALITLAKSSVSRRI